MPMTTVSTHLPVSHVLLSVLKTNWNNIPMAAEMSMNMMIHGFLFILWQNKSKSITQVLVMK